MYPKRITDDTGETIYDLPFEANSILELVHLKDDKLEEFLSSELSTSELVKTKNGEIFVGIDIHDYIKGLKKKPKRQHYQNRIEKIGGLSNVTGELEIKNGVPIVTLNQEGKYLFSINRTDTIALAVALIKERQELEGIVPTKQSIGDEFIEWIDYVYNKD